METVPSKTEAQLRTSNVRENPGATPPPESPATSRYSSTASLVLAIGLGEAKSLEESVAPPGAAGRRHRRRRGDSLADATALRRVTFVIKGGKICATKDRAVVNKEPPFREAFRLVSNINLDYYLYIHVLLSYIAA
jgi:hypothetical protein